MDEIFKRILDKLAGADLWIALGFLAAGYVCWLWLGTTAIDKKKVLRRQIGMALLVVILAGVVVFVNHLFFLRERGFRKNVTGVLVTRIVGDDPLNSLQGALVEKLNSELQKEETGQQIEVHASSEIPNENDGLKVAHERARAIGERLNATIVIWGRKIGEKQFYPRITVIAAPKGWRAVRERTHDEQSITELHLPKELVDEPFYLIHFAAGYSYFCQSNNYGEALLHFKTALDRRGALPKELADLRLFTAFCHYSLGDSDAAKADYDKAIADYSEAIRLDPKDVLAYIYRAVAYQGKGDYDNAIGDCDEAIRLDPKNAKGYSTRGFVYNAKGDYEKAIADYSEALRLDPKNAKGYDTRGLAYEAKSDYDKAIADYDEAIRLDPKDPKAYEIRGAAYHDRGDYDKAIADYDEAIRLDPKYALPYNSLAWLLGTCPQAGFRDGKKAVEYATKACELSMWNDPSMVDTLLPPMPKREISSRPLNGKRNTSKLQTSPKKRSQTAKGDWRSTKPANPTQKSNHGERASAAIHSFLSFLKRSLNAVTVPRPNALNQDCKVTGEAGL